MLWGCEGLFLKGVSRLRRVEGDGIRDIGRSYGRSLGLWEEIGFK